LVAVITADLERFVAAQAPVIGRVLDELRAGRKRTHWMWFVFPQLAGLGRSAMARHFAITDLDEARRYLAHSLLGPRLVQCTELVNAHRGLTAHAIFGSPDDLKFRSSMTLFRAASGEPRVFQVALDRFFTGRPDERTLDLLGRAAG
jgi:uncharacterized protein (DUF1810 family)